MNPKCCICGNDMQKIPAAHPGEPDYLKCPKCAEDLKVIWAEWTKTEERLHKMIKRLNQRIKDLT